MGKKEDIERQLKELERDLEEEKARERYAPAASCSTSKQVTIWGIASLAVGVLNFMLLILIMVAASS